MTPSSQALRAAVVKDPKDRAARFALVRGLQRAKKLDEALIAAQDWRTVDAYNLVVVRLLGRPLQASSASAPKARLCVSAVGRVCYPKDAAAHRASRACSSRRADHARW